MLEVALETLDESDGTGPCASGGLVEPVPPSPAPAPPGRRFGHYEIIARDDGAAWELGHGAMGVTYRAFDTVLHCAVALKVIHRRVAEHPGARERFLHEARAAAQLRHPNVAGVFHYGEEGGQRFYAMELVGGETLEARVRREGPLPAALALEVAEQVARALVAAERCGLVHRDLKPANLMIVAGGGEDGPGGVVIKVIDFGLAKAVAVAVAAGAASLTHGAFVGTPAFASPEQFKPDHLQEGELDTRADIFSLGVTLWFLLTARVPFTGHSLEEIHDRQTRRPLPVEQLIQNRVPAPIVALLRVMLAGDPAGRPPSARELAGMLRRCRNAVGAAARRRPARRLVAGVAAGLLLAGVLAAGSNGWFRRPGPGVAPEIPVPAPAGKSIAVLPFENRSEDKENAFFADGVQDDILTALSKVADLKVISRTSVRTYAAGSKRDLPGIARALGVSHVLEGSVRRFGAKVRISAQLIDTRRDAQLWAETYDRDLVDVFAIQSEIAKTIADQLRANISPREKVAIERPPTSDFAAYDFYVRATALIDTAMVNQTPTENLLQAIYLLDQAVGRDPAFLLAHCKLANAHDRLYRLGFDHTVVRRSLAEAAVSNALRVQPDSGEAHLALAQHLFSQLEYDRAREEVAAARRTLPNDPGTFMLSASIDRQQGRWAESAANVERALELDPRNLAPLNFLAGNYEMLRAYPEGAAALDRVLAIQPADVRARLERAKLEVTWHADPRPLHAFKDALLREDPGSRVRLAPMWVYLALCERDPVAAGHAAADMGDNTFGPSAVQFSRTFTEGLIARMKGDPTAAQAAFRAARVTQERIVGAQPDYAPALCVLGMIDAALGRNEDAWREGRRAVELLPATKDSLNGPSMAEFLAVIYAWTGEKDLALNQLRMTSSRPGLAGYGQLKLLPFWDALRGDARFEELVASLAPSP